MEKRFEKQAETGGDNEQLQDEKLTWGERFLRRLRRRRESGESEADTAETAEKRVGFFEFVRDIFRDDEEPQPASEDRSFIDEAWDEYEASKGAGETHDAQLAESDPETYQEERLAELPEHERTEFYMVVAQRFKDAGNRFIGVLRSRLHMSDGVNISTPESDAARIRDVEAMYEDATEVSPSAEPESVAPPFDFAIQAQPDKSRLPSAPSGLSRAGGFEYGAQRNEGSYQRSPIEGESDTSVAEKNSRFGEILFAGGIGYAFGRRRGRIKTERAIGRKLEKQSREHALEQKRYEQELRRELQSLEQNHAVELRLERTQQEAMRQEALNTIRTEAKKFETDASDTSPGAVDPVGTAPEQQQQAATDTLGNVWRAADALLRDTDSQTLSNNQARRHNLEQDRFMDDEGVAELEFRNLKPANSKEAAQARRKKTESASANESSVGDQWPDGVRARVIANEQVPSPYVPKASSEKELTDGRLVESSPAVSPEIDPRARRQATRLPQTESDSRRLQEATPIAQILSQKQADLQPGQTGRVVTSKTPIADSNTVVALLAVTVAIIVGLLFISAL